MDDTLALVLGSIGAGEHAERCLGSEQLEALRAGVLPWWSFPRAYWQ
jgi:hypothetical protein